VSGVDALARPGFVGDLAWAVGRLRVAEEEAGRCINLVPSENRLSPLARLPFHLDCYSRYFFNDAFDEGRWEFSGSRTSASVETGLTIAALRRLGQAEHVNVRPLSGLSAMLVAVAGLGGEPGATVVSVAPAAGGHYATGRLVTRLGYRSRLVGAGGVAAGGVDVEELRAVVAACRPSLVYLDVANTLRRLPVTEVVKAVREASPATLVHWDCSHSLGLVLAGVFENPLACGADSFGGSTHKTFPGPQKGVLATNSAEIAARLRDAQFFLISSHHFAATLSLGLALREFEHLAGARYGRTVLANAQTFAEALAERGFVVERVSPGSFTETHQVWVRSRDPHGFNQRMYRAGIRANVQDNLPGIGVGVRLGVNELTHLGARREHIVALADAMAAADAGEWRAAARQVRDIRGALEPPYEFPAQVVAEATP
jgi:glycine hydroxymethyltransferase